MKPDASVRPSTIPEPDSEWNIGRTVAAVAPGTIPETSTSIVNASRSTTAQIPYLHDQLRIVGEVDDRHAADFDPQLDRAGEADVVAIRRVGDWRDGEPLAEQLALLARLAMAHGREAYEGSRSSRPVRSPRFPTISPAPTTVHRIVSSAGRAAGAATDDADLESTERGRILREATATVLYVSVVLLATLAALPAGREAGTIQGPAGLELVAIVWGTTIGLAAAHWFAFHVATRGFFGGQLRGQDLKEAMAQLAGAGSVAAAATVPVLIFPPVLGQRVVPFVLALIIGVVGYLAERANHRTRLVSAAFGLLILLIALIVATFKSILSGH